MEHEHLEQPLSTIRRSKRQGCEEPVSLLIRRLVERVGIRYGLTPREKQVLEGGALGRHTKLVASDLQCSPKTIEEYWRRIYRRFKLASRQEIIARLLWESLTDTNRRGQ